MRRKQKSKPRRRRNSRRSLIFVFLLFAGLVLLTFLLFPSLSRLGSSIRSFLFTSAGLLAFLLPAGLILGAVRVLGSSFLRGGFTVLLGAGVNGYFLSALVDMLGRRFDPSFQGRPGGILAGKAVGYLISATNEIAAYLILLACLAASLVIFTGWDLTGGILHLGRAAGAARTRVARRPEEEERDVPEFLGSDHAWAREAAEAVAPALVPGFGPAVEESAGTLAPTMDLSPPGAAKPAPDEFRARPPEGHLAEPGVEAPSARPARPPARPVPARRAELPPIDVLEAPSRTATRRVPAAELKEKAALLVEKLADFGVLCEVSDIRPGPVLTRFELHPGPGVRVNSILGLSDDLALALKAKRIRILAPIPGRDAVGVEVPNANPEPVYLKDVLSAVSGREKLPVALGRMLEGEPFVLDLYEMPHLLVAGTTGSGKSVCIHSMICTLLMKLNPWQVRLAMIDPKRLELSAYEDIPHLWAPVVVDVRKAKLLLESLSAEMDNRYIILQRAGVRSIIEYNAQEALAQSPMPHIVLFIDELADLMQTSANDVEPHIMRLAQMARAVGIHLVVATQRPSVDVITGVIKANFPSRIAFSVSSKTDSRTILDMNGADELLGRGDMLLVRASFPEPLRVHGSFISTEETRRIAEFWKEQALDVPRGFTLPDGDSGNTRQGDDVKGDDLLEDARELVIRCQAASVTLLQKNLSVGYPRAARLIDLLEEQGVVGPFHGGKRREVLVQPQSGGTPGEELS
jgi:DNA segregation ATPase FtsK/SpoIIIE-like protein